MPDPQALEALKAGGDAWINYRSKNSQPDLTVANLRGAYLRRANLAVAYLRGANLSEAHLTAADLSGANLTGADLRRANLAVANLTGADLRGANLTGADLTATDLREADLRGANLTRTNLRVAHLSEADLTEANLTDANPTDAIWPPDHPPTWPEGFQPPENAWTRARSESVRSEVPESARELHPVRVERVATEDLAAFARTIEPLLGVAEELLDSGGLSDESAALIEYARNGLRRELWENPGEPNPAVLVAYQANLIGLVGEHLPATVTDERTEPNRADEAARAAVERVPSLGEANPIAAGEAAADIADDLSRFTAEIESPGNDPSSEEAQKAARQSVLQHLGWIAGRTSSGAGIGATVLPAVHAASPAWGAVLGSIGGLLAYLFKVTVYDQ